MSLIVNLRQRVRSRCRSTGFPDNRKFVEHPQWSPSPLLRPLAVEKAASYTLTEDPAVNNRHTPSPYSKPCALPYSTGSLERAQATGFFRSGAQITEESQASHAISKRESQGADFGYSVPQRMDSPAQLVGNVLFSQVHRTFLTNGEMLAPKI